MSDEREPIRLEDVISSDFDYDRLFEQVTRMRELAQSGYLTPTFPVIHSPRINIEDNHINISPLQGLNEVDFMRVQQEIIQMLNRVWDEETLKNIIFDELPVEEDLPLTQEMIKPKFLIKNDWVLNCPHCHSTLVYKMTENEYNSRKFVECVHCHYLIPVNRIQVNVDRFRYNDLGLPF